jgi:tetratricopeptide (TPR) repeat protein
LGNLGYNYAQLGLFKLARTTLEQSLVLNEAMGERRKRAYNLQNLGWTCLRTGDGRTARRLLEESLRELAAAGDAFGQQACLLYLGYAAERAGDAAGAARRYGEALAGFRASVRPRCGSNCHNMARRVSSGPRSAIRPAPISSTRSATRKRRAPRLKPAIAS